MLDRGKHNLLGVRLDAVDYEAAVAHLVGAARDRRPATATALAVHGVMSGVLDPVHRHRLNRLDLVVPDGQPIRWGLNLLHGTDLAERVYGPTLMLELCAAAAEEGLPIFLYGSSEAVSDRLAARLRERFPRLRLAGRSPSSFRRVSAEEKAEIVARIRASGAALVFVGLGCPRQEVWAYEYGPELGMPVVAVGAAFDFHAGLLPQAPAWLQRRGLEWLFRLWQEPRRLWRRYLLLNPAYLLLLGLQWSGLRRFDPARTVEPPEEVRFG
jgi:N-acetylglucosaminyldiphosphoundecaprenol N-acetyl-beta-D-mannosaminyltransferase